MEVSNFIEEVDLIFPGKQCRSDAVNGRIAPTLLKEHLSPGPLKVSVLPPHLIVESTLLVQELYKFRVSLAPPEIEIADLKIAPDCFTTMVTPKKPQGKVGLLTVATVVSLSTVI